MMYESDSETSLACERCHAEDISGSITRAGKIACSKCMSSKRDPWLWDIYEGIGDLEATPDVRPNPEYEGPAPKVEGVGMFESDLWEVGMDKGAMRGAWSLPHARGGFVHSPTVTSPVGSKYHVPVWQKIRSYALQHPEKAVKDIVKDLGVNQGTASAALLGKEGKGSLARYHPDLERIVPGQSLQIQRAEATRRMFTGFGPDSEVDEREAMEERVVELFKEKTLDGTLTQSDALDEIAEEFNIGRTLVYGWVKEAGLYSREKSMAEMGRRRSKTLLGRKGISQEDIEEYIRIFGEETTDVEVAEALGITQGPVGRARKKLGFKPYRTLKREKEAKRLQDYISSQNEYMTTEQMAEALNVTLSTVNIHRKRLGLVGIGKQIGGLSRIRGSRDTRLEAEPRYEEIKEYLLEYGGKIPDRDIIKNLKITHRTLKAYRDKLGIKMYKRSYEGT